MTTWKFSVSGRSAFLEPLAGRASLHLLKIAGKTSAETARRRQSGDKNRATVRRRPVDSDAMFGRSRAISVEPLDPSETASTWSCLNDCPLFAAGTTTGKLRGMVGP